MKEFIESLIKSLIIVLLIYLFQKTNPTWIHYTILSLVLIAFYYFIIRKLDKIKSFVSKKIRIIYPKIGILNGQIKSAFREHKCERVWTEVTPSMWFNKLKTSLHDRKLKTIRMINTSEIDDSFLMIINPFGDNLPEEDTKLHHTFYRICNYIEKGGIFIVTGGAFFWNQNTASSGNKELFIQRLSDGLQSIKDSPLNFEFGVSTTGNIYKDGKLIFEEPVQIDVCQSATDKELIGDILHDIKKIERFRAALGDTSEYIPFIREEGDKSFPLVAVKYGKGYLVHGGMYLRSENSSELRIMIEALKHLISNKLT